MLMRTAVSLPEELFAAAEETAKRLRVSRSELYARAIAEFLDHAPDSGVTELLNQVYGESPDGLEPGLCQAQVRSLDQET